MQRVVILVAVIILALLALPFVLGVCAFRLDSVYYLQGQTEVNHGPLVVSFNAIKCYSGGQKSSIPGALSPNDRANGFQVGWEYKGDSANVLTVKNIKAELVNQNESKPLDVPFTYWYGESTVSKNVYFAFISTGGYTKDLQLGTYQVRLSYTANGASYVDNVTLDYVVTRKLGFHSFFYSKYF